jgi:hypothetical protein
MRGVIPALSCKAMEGCTRCNIFAMMERGSPVLYREWRRVYPPVAKKETTMKHRKERPLAAALTFGLSVALAPIAVFAGGGHDHGTRDSSAVIETRKKLQKGGRDKTQVDTTRSGTDRSRMPRNSSRDTLLDTLRAPGTPGSPTGQGTPEMER